MSHQETTKHPKYAVILLSENFQMHNRTRGRKMAQALKVINAMRPHGNTPDPFNPSTLTPDQCVGIFSPVTHGTLHEIVERTYQITPDADNVFSIDVYVLNPSLMPSDRLGVFENAPQNDELLTSVEEWKYPGHESTHHVKYFAYDSASGFEFDATQKLFKRMMKRLCLIEFGLKHFQFDRLGNPMATVMNGWADSLRAS